MAVTLVQVATDQRVSPTEGAFIQMFDQFSPVFSEAPMVGTDELFYDYERVAVLPSISWRAFNQAWPESSGSTTTFREYLKVLGGEVKIDKQFVNGPRGARTVTRQTEMKILSAVNEWDRSFFEGSELNSVTEMTGLRNRLTGNQLILNAAGGGTFSVAQLDALIDSVPFVSDRMYPGMRKGEGTNKCLYMNRWCRRRLGQLLDATTGARRMEVTRNNWGEQVEVYNGCVIKVVEESGTGNSILGFDEVADSGSAVCASVYCVAWGEGQIHALYRKPSNNGQMLEVFKVNELEAEPRMMIRFEGMYGIAIEHPRAAGRLYGITQT